MWFLNDKKTFVKFFSGDIEVSKYPYCITIDGLTFYEAVSTDDVDEEFNRLVRWLNDRPGEMFCFGEYGNE